MKLVQINIKNFRQFKGPHSLDLSPKGGKNINIIHANNGFGKTATYRAINWCLFHKEPRLKAHQNDVPSRLNFKAEHSAKVGMETPVSVELKFLKKDENGKERPITIMRREFYRKVSGLSKSSGKAAKSSLLHAKNELQLTYYDNKGKGSIELENERAENYIERNVINSELKTFYFFDGENVSKFIEDNRANKVADHLDLLTSVTDMQRVFKNLGVLQTKLISKRPKGETEDLDELIITKTEHCSQLAVSIKELSSELDKTDKSIETFKGEIDRLRTDIAKNADTKKLMSQRDELDTKKRNLHIELDKVETHDRLNILENMSSVLSYKLVLDLDNIIGKKIDDDELPPPIIQNIDAIDTIIDKNNIVIDNDIFAEIKWKNKKTNKESFLKAIADFNKESVNKRNSQLARLAMKTKDFTSSLLRLDPKNVFELSKQSHDEKKTIQKNIKEIEDERISLTKQMGSFDDDEHKRNVKFLQVNEQHLKESRFTRGVLQGRLETSLETFESDKKHIVDMRKRQGTGSLLNQQIEFIEKSKELLEDTIENTRQSIVKSTSKRFSSLVNKISHKKNFFNAEITDEYSIKVLNQLNKDLLPKNGGSLLSTGELFVMGYCYMIAMEQGVDQDFPFLIDTPLSASDPKYKMAIIDEIVSLSKEGKQFTFFFTKSELDKDVHNRLKKYTANEYQIMNKSNGEDGHFERKD
jgi:DNA sulfur modification protein DndD